MKKSRTKSNIKDFLYSMVNVYDTQTWIDHLKNDIMPYWSQPGLLGEPVGNFPTYANQSAQPKSGCCHYMRMSGRQIYGYLMAHHLLQEPLYLGYAEKGFQWLERFGKNPRGGYWSQLSPDGTPLEENITIQDLCYTVFPYLTSYKLQGRSEDLEKVLDTVRFIVEGPYFRNGLWVDSLAPDYSEVRYFESDTLNIVSVLDLMNLLIVPMAERDDPLIKERYPELFDVLKIFLDLLVTRYWAEGIFWNESGNRSNYTAKHVDFGHTSKAYGIVFRANRILARRGESVKYKYLERYYTEMVQAASDKFGWRTDFLDSYKTFSPGALQWWRHILVDQTATLYALEYPELIPAVKNGLEKYLELPFVDRTRDVRGIREGLRPDGTLWSDEENIFCKANLWKNAYHEVEHVVSALDYIKNLSGKQMLSS